MQDLSKKLGKLAFVAFCCTSAAQYAITKPYVRSFEKWLTIPAPPSLSVPLILFLAALLVLALCVGSRGKHWASWAVLAYSSWMVMPCGAFFHILWYAQDVLATLWFGPLTQGLVLLFFFWGGMHAALRNQWKAMGGWWLTGYLLYLIVLMPQQMYASHFALQRQKARQAVSSAKIP